MTIVTPSYNQGEFIRATIESVLAQDYPRLEYIIMDGGSTDQTAAIVGEYAGRLTWISEKDRGQAHAINKGFAMATGEIVAWLNSDDILLPGAVARAVNAFAAAPPGVGAIYGEGYLLDREGRITRRFPATEPFNLWKLTYLSDYILQQSVFFRRAAIEEIGWLDENLHYALDWDLLIRLESGSACTMLRNISARCANTRRPRASREAGRASRKSGLCCKSIPAWNGRPAIGPMASIHASANGRSGWRTAAPGGCVLPPGSPASFSSWRPARRSC